MRLFCKATLTLWIVLVKIQLMILNGTDKNDFSPPQFSPQLQVFVKAGDKVQIGDPLMVMIAMKMEVSDI